MTLKNWISFFFFFFQIVATAQINESDTVKFQARISLTGLYQTGNVELLTVRYKLDFAFSPQKQLVFKSQNNNLYQQFYSTKTDNDLFSRNYLYYKPQKKIYPFAIVYVSSNYRRSINWRYFTGAGATWQIIYTKNEVVKLSANVVYESTKFNGSVYNLTVYNGQFKLNVWRATIYSGGYTNLNNKKLRLYYDVFYQPALSNKNNYRLQIDVGADVPVWKGLALNSLYSFTRENVVLKNIKINDQIITFGFVYNLKTKHK